MNNPLDSQFPFSNAALGIFQSFQQASKFIEGTWIYNNAEFFIQDNWKVTNRLTLDYGLRFVHQQPQYDTTGQSGNFLPEAWTLGAAPRLYVPGCANGVYPCTGNNRQAMDPVTGLVPGAEHHAGDRRARPRNGEHHKRAVPLGPGHSRHRVRLPDDGLRAPLRRGV